MKFKIKKYHLFFAVITIILMLWLSVMYNTSTGKSIFEITKVSKAEKEITKVSKAEKVVNSKFRFVFTLDDIIDSNGSFKERGLDITHIPIPIYRNGSKIENVVYLVFNNKTIEEYDFKTFYSWQAFNKERLKFGMEVEVTVDYNDYYFRMENL